MNVPVHHTAKDTITICMDGTSPDFFATIKRELVEVVETCALMSLPEAAQMAKDILTVLLKENEELAKDVLFHGEVELINKEISCSTE